MTKWLVPIMLVSASCSFQPMLKSVEGYDWCKSWLAPILLVSASCSYQPMLKNIESDDWCGSSMRQALRARRLSAPAFPTINVLTTESVSSTIALFAHRGGIHCEEMDRAPENSIANVENAIRMGFDGYETDLWPTSDGEYLIHHDATLDRTTTGSGPVSAITFEKSRVLRLKYPSGKVSREQIPTLRELLEAGNGRIIFLIQLKGTSARNFQEIHKIVSETNSVDHVLYWITASEENVDLYKREFQANIEQIRNSVVWRVESVEQFQNVKEAFDSKLVDLVPSWKEVYLEESFLGLRPRDHLTLIETAVTTPGTKAMVSRLGTNSYLDQVIDSGVGIVMSRHPEIQLAHLRAKGLHH